MSTAKLVAFQPDRPPRAVTKRFPEAESQIETLWLRDEEFREICRDYREARASLGAVSKATDRESGGKGRELAELLAELEGEMLSVIERRLRLARR